MLHPFLFIGVGGSGGKTLRTLRADLQQRLAEAGDDGPWPTCWQLLHIDVPTDADGNEPDLPRQLEDKDYKGLVGRKITYEIIDKGLTSSGQADDAILRNLIGWRPDPRRVRVPIEKGAGQFRALGRSIVVANLATVAEALSQSMEALHGPQMSADLNRVARALGVPISDAPGPEAVIVSSLAGGSGSGAFLDICDTLRAVGGSGYADGSYAVLYAPDVFNHIPPEGRRGVNANALAALCELMSGFWDVEPSAEDFALVQSKGRRAVGAANRRGPRFPLIVGTKNDKVGFSHQNDVYRAMGKALAAWTVSEHLQQEIKSYAVGNWGLSSQMPDHTGFKNGDQEQTLCAIGFGRVSLGRDNFADYASQRIARKAVERILRQHLADRPPEADPNHEVAIEEVVNSTFKAFLEESGLDERGEERDQVLDALRPKDRLARLEASTQFIRSNLVGVRTQAVPAHQWRAEAVDFLLDQRGRFADDETTQRNAQARDWVKDIEERLIALTAKTVAAYGAPVTEKLLGRLRTEMEFVLTELPDEKAKYARWAEEVDPAVSAVLPPTNEALMPENPRIAEAVSKGVDCFDYLAEADLRGFAGALLKDLLHNLIEPLHIAVRGGREVLAIRETGTATEPSEVARWPEHDLIPRRFHPAGNEFLLESVDTYPETYRDLLTRSAASDDPGGAEAEYVRHAIVGSRPVDREAQSLIRVHTSWIPSLPELQTAFGTSARAQFELSTSPSDILDRARHLVDDRDSAIGTVVAESLQDYLDEEKIDPGELQRRKDRFHDAFGQAMATSKPLVNIDPQTLSRVHEVDAPNVSYLFTEIPFPEGTPGFEIVRSTLESQGRWDDKVQSAFGEGRQSRIDVFSMLASAYNPVVFESLMGPIADEWSEQQLSADRRDAFWRWRRARPLSSFVPVSSEVRLAMVRGWFTARLLGLLKFDQADRSIMDIWDPQSRDFVSFPRPLLGPDVHQDWERLPAALESLPIAMIQFVERGARGDEALAPYWQLRRLGCDARGASHDYETVNQVLESWILRGATAPGAPAPRVDLAGPAGDTAEEAEDRKDRCIATVRDWRKRYGDLINAPVTIRDFYSVPRAAEIGTDIIETLDELDHALTQVVAAGATGEW